MQAILGQQRALGQLQQQLEGDRLHHAFIFHGPPGVGKFTTALALAKLLLCHDPQTTLQGESAACDACASCRLFAEDDQAKDLLPVHRAMRLAHPDLHLIVKEMARFSDNREIRNRKLTVIPVDVVEQHLLEPVARAPMLGHRKLFIVDEAELLNDQSQNKMLKTLEEPPPGTVIILATSHEDRLLPTIRSRCSRVAFTPLSEQEMSTWLNQHHPDLDPAQRAWLLSFAQGSPGQAQLARQHEVHRWAEDVVPSLDAMTRGQYDHQLGQRMSRYVEQFTDAYLKHMENMQKAFASSIDESKGAEQTPRNAGNRLGARLLWSMILHHVRERIASVSSDQALADPGPASSAVQPWLAMVDLVDDCEDALQANLSLSLVFDHFALQSIRLLSRAGR